MKKRLFVALDPPETIRQQLVSLCCGLRDVRWTSPDQFHLTLSFIGEVDGDAFLDIREGLAAVKAAPFDMHLRGVGFFPPRGHPRVVWVGGERTPPLLQLQRAITSRLFLLGFRPENRKFAPHVTLGRLRGAASARQGAYLREHALVALPPFPVEQFLLYSSVLGRNSAHHIVEASYPLITITG
ncbi:MAG: RNA 2',3'-cyclic phosphodiesterase [Desulfobulbus sp.]